MGEQGSVVEPGSHSGLFGQTFTESAVSETGRLLINTIRTLSMEPVQGTFGFTPARVAATARELLGRV
jgi:hypothetical protein